jgi:hypothetical protein
MMKWKPDCEKEIDACAKASEPITDPSEKGKRLCPAGISRDADHQTTSLAETKLIQKLSEIFEPL